MDSRPAASLSRSTNVRSVSLRRAILRTAIRALGGISPGLAAAWAGRLFCTPPKPRPLSGRARGELGKGRRIDVPFGRRRLAAWSWGDGPSVYLLHGWGGRAGQLTSFVEPLVSAGYRAIALDAPAHGESDGRRTSLLEFAVALRAVAAREGEAHAVVAHSLGGAAAAHAMRAGLPVGRAVFFGSPADPAAFFRGFLASAGAGEPLRRAIAERMERRLGFRWADLPIPSFSERLDVPLLILHDRDDAEVPWRDGDAIASSWPGASLVTTQGLGHRRILRDPGAVSLAVDFITRPAASGPVAASGAER